MDKCVNCNRPVHIFERTQKCSCCDETYAQLLLNCENCGLEIVLTAIDPIAHEKPRKKRGIGRTQ